MCSENDTDAAEAGCGDLCGRKSHSEFGTTRRQAAEREVILFEGAFQLEASMHIVRRLLKWRESVLVGEEKRNINLNVFAKK